VAKKLDGILIEVNGGLVSHVEVDGIPTNAYYLIDWDCLLGDGDTREAGKNWRKRSRSSSETAIPPSPRQSKEGSRRKPKAGHSRANPKNGGQ